MKPLCNLKNLWLLIIFKLLINTVMCAANYQSHQEQYQEKRNTYSSQLAGEITQWKDEYSENQHLIAKIGQQIEESESKTWLEALSSAIYSGEIIFFKAPDSLRQKGISVTLVTKGFLSSSAHNYIQHNDMINGHGPGWTRDRRFSYETINQISSSFAFVIQYIDEKNSQILFVPLKIIKNEGSWYANEVGGFEEVLKMIIFPRKEDLSIPYGPFMTWWIEPVQAEWSRAYATYQNLLNNLGRKEGSYFSLASVSCWQRMREWCGSTREINPTNFLYKYPSFLLKGFGIIRKEDLMDREEDPIRNFSAVASRFDLKLLQKLLAGRGTLITRGQEDFIVFQKLIFQGYTYKVIGARIHPWVIMNLGRYIKNNRKILAALLEEITLKESSEISKAEEI